MVGVACFYDSSVGTVVAVFILGRFNFEVVVLLCMILHMLTMCGAGFAFLQLTVCCLLKVVHI